MNNQNPLRRYPLISTFILLALVVIGLRWMTRHEPLDRDISAYAVIGRELLTGRVLYADLWDHKPPAMHMAFAGATAVVGPGAPAVLLVNIVFSLAVLGGLMVAGRRIGGSTGAVVAGVLWVLVGGDLGLHANQPNTELPMNACMVWALALALSGRSRGPAKAWLLPGALAGIAVLLKPIAAAPFGLLAAAETIDRWRALGLKAAVVAALRWIGGFGLVVAPVLLWSVVRAGLDPVWDALIRFNLAYSQAPLMAHLRVLGEIGSHLPTSTLAILALLAAAGAVGLIHIAAPGRYLILAVLLGAAGAVASTGRSYPHYYQLLLPSLLVAATAGLSWAAGRRDIARLTAAGVLIAMAFIEFPSTRLSADEWSREKHGGVFIDERRIADGLRNRLTPGEPFWQLGAQPGLYLLTDTLPASGVVYDIPLRPSSPIHEEISLRVISELARRPPRLIVVDSRIDNREVIRWIHANYHLTRLPSPVAGFQLWEPRQATAIRLIEQPMATGDSIRAP